MKITSTALSILFICVSVAIAVPPGKTITFDKSPMGKVVFAGVIHKDAGFSCKNCHNPQLFPKMKKGTVDIKMKAIYSGEQCGFCHNGEKAFSAKGNCKRCHTK